MVRSVSLVRPLLASIKVLKAVGGASYSYEKYRQVLIDRVAHYGDKKLALSSIPSHVSSRRGMETFDGMFPFYLPLGVRVRSDRTLPHLPPLTKKISIYKYT